MPQAVILLMVQFYPKIYPFANHNEDIFEISNENTIIKGKSDCQGYMIYANLLDNDDTGLRSGIHTWSIKALSTSFYDENQQWISKYANCFRNIGITTVKASDNIEPTATANNLCTFVSGKGYHSCIDGMHCWGFDQIITVKLDCYDWSVTYYHNLNQMEKKYIEPNQKYYFAICCCGSKNETHLQVVDTPTEILNDLL